ncbi:MAG TPA: protein kinase, partial [Candidatus Acidoferrum sp.]|nr:protein kinase [Candidatus Acidoferrum sp.]
MTSILKAGRYEIVAELGRGAMGVVYKATDPVIGRPVAVKTIKLSEQGTGLTRSELIARFQTEARAAGLLTHHNIVVVYDAGEEDGLFYITMELVEGKSVQALLDSGHAFPLPRVLRIMEQACNALQFAHENNIVHRDIKPANIMLTGDDTVKVTDFGTAKILQFGTVQQTAHVMGTPSYMSPEQVKGRAVDGRTDIFSLGVMLYEMITGEKPFPGESITTVIYKIVNEVPVPPRTIDPTIHPGISTAVMRALAKEPEDRYQSCHEFLEDLRNYRNLSEGNARTTVPSLGNRNVAPNATVAMNPGLRGLAADNPHMTPARRQSDGLAEPYAPSPLQRSLMRGTDQIPAYEPPKEKSIVWTVLAAIVLVAVIGFGAYKLKPVLYDVRHPEVRRDAIANTAAQPSAVENAPSPATGETATPQSDATPTTAQNSQSSAAPNATQPTAAQTQPTGATEKSDSTQSWPQTAQQNASSAANAPIDSTPQPAQVAASEKSNAEKVVTEKTAAEKIPVNAEEASRKQPAVTKTPAGLTPKAAQVKKKIDDALVEKNLSGKASVQGVGNTLTITGKLRPGQHAALLNLLHDVPAGVRIVDNIGDDTAAPAPSSATTTSSVTPKTQNAATAAVSPATTASSNVPAQASTNSDAPKVTGARVAWANVTSTPAGAEIYIDDFPTGQKTP